MFKRWLQRYRCKRFLNWPLQKLDTLHLDMNPADRSGKMDLVVIAFNQPQLLVQQLRLIRKYLPASIVYTVADNSTDLAASAQIRAFCDEAQVGYIRLPANPYRRDGSRSHGIALDFVVRQYIHPRGCEFFGLLDHDIFPVAVFHPVEVLRRQECYGLIQRRDEKWYLWPGLCFFRTANAPDSFMPVPGLDTGGAGWEPYYRFLDATALDFIPHDGTHEVRSADADGLTFEFFGDWRHCRDASNWQKKGDVQAVLERKLQYLRSF